MHLLDERHAILELSKDQLTTDPARHTGDGIFFTSRMFDSFDLQTLDRPTKTVELRLSLPFVFARDGPVIFAVDVGYRGRKRCNVAAMGEPLDSWFKREILSHEDILMRFLSRVWPRRDEVPDIRQESYARVYEAAQKSRPQAPKAFLFATAKHLMADRVRRERIVSIQAGGENDYLNVLIDEISPEQRVGANQELVRLARAFDRLSPKCREVMWLRRVKELSQKEVAARLALAEKTVEKHLRSGARLLAHYMSTDLTPRAAPREGELREDGEIEHGDGTHS
jgi:RNA polymerase sigma-70 factor (ECF subfamily)